MKQSHAIRLILAMTIGLVSATSTQAENIVIPAGTPVIVKLLETVSSGTHKKGDRVNFQVVTDVLVNGKTVVKAGTLAEGQVESASKKFFAGIGGQIDISLQNTKAVSGAPVPLVFRKETHGGSSVLSIVLTVVCCLCFVFIRGDDVSIEKDTLFNATVLGPTEVALP